MFHEFYDATIKTLWFPSRKVRYRNDSCSLGWVHIAGENLRFYVAHEDISIFSSQSVKFSRIIYYIIVI